MDILKKSLAVMLLAAPLLTLAAEPPPPGQPRELTTPRDGHRDGGKHCDMKGHGPQGADRRVMIPKLPAGNEKQQLLMQAEIQQKVAEIVTKYLQQLP
ncbi:MAG: hypothetical protein EXR83_10755 [Gammaproteobacteria bacterium]|nr:hypothetical protein [Gammaproteobacteria bacterium]